MELLNSLVYEEKEYSLDDVRGFIQREDFGLPEGFYGGRVDKVAKTDVEGLYLCMEGMTVIDILIDDIPFSEAPKSLQELTNKELIALLEEKGIEVPNRANKNELLALFDIEEVEE